MGYGSFVTHGFVRLLLGLYAAPIKAASQPAKPRGVGPDWLSHYDLHADTFRCVDGSKSIQTSRVTDEYCYCFDGSDEPGPLQAFKGEQSLATNRWAE